MLFISILFLPFIIYGLWTGRVWVGGYGNFCTYSRQSEPHWYWSAMGMYSIFVGLGIAATLRPSWADAINNGFTAFVLIGVAMLLVAVAYSAYSERDNE